MLISHEFRPLIILSRVVLNHCSVNLCFGRPNKTYSTTVTIVFNINEYLKMFINRVGICVVIRIIIWMRNESALNYVFQKFDADRADSFQMARSVNYPIKPTPPCQKP